MKGTKKVTALLLAFIFVLALPAAAYELSPGKTVIQEENIRQKLSPQNTAISFDADSLLSEKGDITILELPNPDCGTLLYSNQEVVPYQQIKERTLKKLVFMPNKDFVGEAAFIYRIDCDSPVTLQMKMHITDKVIEQPTAADQTVTTIKNVSVTGQLEGSDQATPEVKKEPKKGTVTLSGNAFVYTPSENKTGADSFQFVMKDEYGQVSKAATVKVKIEKPTSDLQYADLSDSFAELPAIKLTEMGVMGGENIAGQNFFSPTSTVNRGDFLTMAMKAADRAPASATGSFDEDRAVLTNVYATEAVAAGLITGDAEGNLALSAPITRSEAAVILSKLLPETSDVATYSFSDPIPEDVAVSVAKLADAGIIYGYEDGTFRASAPVTKAECAVMLERMIARQESEQTSGGIFGWFA